jgi:EAL domain-containing protein (putative c-di-GMP-specific phosphodiesterase class I)
MKRGSSRALVEQLGRSDVRGGGRSRKASGAAILGGELAAALADNQLVLHYQPIVDLRSGECRRVEALLRWRHPRLGLLEPADFLLVPLASELIEEIGVWVVREAARQWTEWRTRGPALGIGVNVSAPELARADAFLEALAPLGSGAMTFELTFQAFVTPAARVAISRLAAAGAHIALDGAGAEDAPGRALAAQLDEIKISRALVRRASAEPNALADMRSLVELARDYRLTSVAVGIEDRGTRELAVSLGCELAQGYFVSRPLVPGRLGPWRRWAAGVALTGSLTFTGFAGIGKAAANGGGQQTPTLVKGVLATACSLDLPNVTARTDVALRCERTALADIYTEESVAPAIRDALAEAVERDVAKLEQDFGRAFASRPAIYAFATRNSFAFGLQEIFGVRGPDAGLLAVANGGITLPRQGAIVLNLQNVPNKDFAIVRHELTHALVHETIGLHATLPAWFDEGLATLAERDGGATTGARSSAVALSILTEGRTTLADLDQQTQWAQRNAALDGQAYSVAAEAVRLLEQRVTRQGVMRILHAVSGGSTFGAAYVDEAGESIADFERSFPARLAADQSDARIVQTARPDGALWTLSGFTPESVVTIAIDGDAYHLEYQIRTDKYGMHQGSFGGTAPKGDYTIRASSLGTSATTTIRT